MNTQLELFNHDWNDTSLFKDENEVIADLVVSHHEHVIQLEEAKTEASMEHDYDRYDDLSILQCDIEVAAESGDQDRLIELIQMKTAYQQ